MSALMGPRWRRMRALAAWTVVVASAGCDGDSGSRTPTATEHVLRVQATGAGSGTVTSPDASPEISCTITAGALSGACAMAYPTNSTVQLTAAPNAASTFAGWSGACTGTDPCVVNMSQERTVNASFVPTAAAVRRATWATRAWLHRSRVNATAHHGGA